MGYAMITDFIKFVYQFTKKANYKMKKNKFWFQYILMPHFLFKISTPFVDAYSYQLPSYNEIFFKPIRSKATYITAAVTPT